MGQLVYSVVGAAVGFWVGGPTGAQYGWMAGSLLGAVANKPDGTRGPLLDDLKVIGTEYGQCIPFVIAGPRMSAQVIWASTVRPIATRTSSGKGSAPSHTSYTYEVDILLMLSENVTAGVAREWLNSEMVYNGVSVKAGVWAEFIVYTGEADQMPDPTYEAAIGVGRAPAYRGHTTIMIRGLQLGTGKNIPNLESEIAIAEATNYLLDVPFTEETQYEDIAPNPQAPDIIQGALEFSPSQLIFRQIASGSGTSALVRYSSGKFDFTGTEDQDVHLEFDFEVVEIDGSGYGFSTSVFQVQHLSATPFLQCDAALSSGDVLTLGFYSTILGATSVTVSGAPYSARIRLSFPEGTNDRVEIYVDDDLRGTVTFPEPTTRANCRLYLDPGVYAFGYRSVRRWGASNLRLSFGEHGVIEPVTETLQQTMNRLMTRAGYHPSEYDTSALATITQPVRGYAVSQVTTTRAAIEPLRGVFFFESAESDRIEFFPRSVTPAGEIDWRDLNCNEDRNDNSDPFLLTLGNELELPAQIALRYANISADHNVGTEFSDRLVSSQVSTQTVEAPISLLPIEAKRAVTAMLLDLVAGLGRATIRLPLKYAKVSPGQIWSLTDPDGREYRLRVLTKRDSTIPIEFDVTLDEAAALTNPVETFEGYVPTTEPVRVAPTLWEAMDIPLLRDPDDQPGYYVALTPQRLAASDEWPGAAYVRAWTAEDFEQVFISGDAAVLGSCVTVLGGFPGGSGRFDESNRLRVEVYGELASTTRADMLDDLAINAAVVGDELIRFRDAIFVNAVDGRNVYDLTGLMRGQRGTEQHIGGHGAAERFVLLNGLIRRVVDQNSELDVESQVKAVTLNLRLSDVDSEPFTDTGVSLMPFSVVNLRALPDGDDLSISWQRRTRRSYRYGGTVGVSVPLGELVEAYRVRIYDGSTLVRTAPAMGPSYTYTAANMASDGFAPGDPITVVVTQLSEIVGDGFPAEVTGIAP